MCKGHPHRRDLYDICETNELGEVRLPVASIREITELFPRQTAMQVYCKNYKQVQIAQTHGLLRKARRLDTILNGNGAAADGASTLNDLDAPQSIPDPQCYRCHTEFSPKFHPASPNGHSSTQGRTELWLCHRCHFEGKGSGMSNGFVSSSV